MTSRKLAKNNKIVVTLFNKAVYFLANFKKNNKILS